MRYDVPHDRVQLWNTNTPAFVSCDADLTENYMYISMKFGTGVMYFAGKLVYLIVRLSNQLAAELNKSTCDLVVIWTGTL